MCIYNNMYSLSLSSWRVYLKHWLLYDKVNTNVDIGSAYRAWYRYNTVTFLQNIYNRHQ